MKQLAYITQGHSEYDPALRELLDATGIDPEEFVGLDYFSLTPFFVLAGATVTPDAHTHGTDVHVTGVVVSIPEELETGFFAALPEFLADAYGSGGEVSSQPGSVSTRLSSADTTRGSNCVPEQRRSSWTATAIGIALRY